MFKGRKRFLDGRNSETVQKSTKKFFLLVFFIKERINFF